MSESSSSLGIALTTTIPTDAQIPYTAPSTPTLLSLAAYLLLLALPTLLSNAYPIAASPLYRESEDREKSISSSNPNVPTEHSSQTYTPNAALTLILPLLLGALFGPSITSNSILSTSTQRTLMDIGYIGVLLLIFEAGVSLDAASLKLMRNNAGLSTLAALTGVLVPIALSMGLGMGAYGYTGLQAFASGAALCSTSLGTTLALLGSSSSGTTPGADTRERSQSMNMDLKRTRVGCVLVCAALLDDIIGLVIAGIIPGLAQSESGVRWPVVVRPILVSLAFGLGTPAAALGLRWLIRLPWKTTWASARRMFNRRCHGHVLNSSGRTEATSTTCPRPQILFLFIVLTLMGFVAGASYAGTSELFGAYLAGAFIGYIFEEEAKQSIAPDNAMNSLSLSNTLEDRAISEPQMDGRNRNSAHAAFVAYLQPILTHLLAPLFFASIGAALPIKAMFTTHPDAVETTFIGSDAIAATEVINGQASHQVVWRGLLYAVLMVLGKMVVGIWMLIWPNPDAKSCHPKRIENNAVRRTGQCLPYDISPIQWVTSKLKSVSKSLPRPNAEDLPRSIPQEQEQNDSTHETPSNDPSRVRSALLLGLAMVARGEIALIVAQLARPLLVGGTSPSIGTTSSTMGTENTTSRTIPIPDEEPFAVVIWAILVSTVGGALGVGVLIAFWQKKDREEVKKKHGVNRAKGSSFRVGSSCLTPTHDKATNPNDDVETGSRKN